MADGAATLVLPGSLPSGTGIVKVTSGTGSVATAGTDYIAGNWLAARRAEAIALAPTLEPAFFDECWDPSVQFETAVAINTGLSQSITTEDGGCFQVKSGTSASSLQIVRSKNSLANPKSVFVSNQKTHPWAVFHRVKIITTPDSQTTMLFPTCNSTNTEIGIVLRGAISTTKLSFWVNGNSPTTKVSAQTADIAGTYHNVGMVFDTTTLHLVYDGSVVDTLTDLTNFDTTPANTRAYCGNGTTAANQEFHLDKWAFFAPLAV